MPLGVLIDTFERPCGGLSTTTITRSTTTTWWCFAGDGVVIVMVVVVVFHLLRIAFYAERVE